MSVPVPTVDLRPDHWDIVRSALRRHVPDREVLAFGSRATWTAKDYSDLDLAIMGEEPLPLHAASALSEALGDSDLPFRVDIVDWAMVDDSFRAVIRRDAVAVQTPPRRSAPLPTPVRASSPDAGATDRWVTISLRRACTKIGSGATPRGGKDVYLPGGLCALIRSQNVFNKGFRHEGLAYIGEQHAHDLAGVEVRHKDVLLNITGDSVARVCQVDPRILPARVNQHVAIIRPDPARLDPGFLRYFLVDPRTQAKLLSWAGSGGTRNALTKAMIEAVDVQAPEAVSQQRAIAHVLGTLDDKIELNRRMNETLEALARALFKSWFVDFDPVRAKMEGRDTGLPDHLADLFPDRLVDSESGEIPEGWVHDTVYRFANIVYGAPFASKQFNTENEGMPLIRIRDLATHSPSVSTQQVHGKGHLIDPGDIVVGMDGAFRLQVWKGPTSWLNQRVCHFEPRPGIPTSFLAGALQEPLAFFERAKVGTTVIHLGKRDLDTIRLLHPGQEVLDTFAGTAEPLLDKAVANSREARTLAALRDTLLPKLISGEIRVPDAECTLAPVT